MSIHAYETKKGIRYAVVVYQDGKQVWRRGFESERKAKAEERRLLVARDRGDDVNPERLRFAVTDPKTGEITGGYAHRWLAYKRPRIRPTTYKLYTDVMRAQIAPYVGKVRLIDLKPMHVELMIDGLTARGLTRRTIQTARGILASSLLQAVKWQLITRVATDAVEPLAIPRRVFSLPTRQQLEDLTAAADATPIGNVVRLALATGMREGELLRLTWRDVNLTGPLGVLTVSQAKTSAGVRTLHVGPEATAMLRGMQRESGRVFELSALQVQRTFAQVRTHAGIPSLRFHDLRHVHVSALIEAGVDFKVIQERVGHASITVTLDIYGHLRPQRDADAAALAERFIG